MKPQADVQPTPESEPPPVHICCLFDPKRPRTRADPSSEDKAYVCSHIINGRAEKTIADEFRRSRAQWTAAAQAGDLGGVMEIFLGQGTDTLAKHSALLKQKQEGRRAGGGEV